MSHFVDLWLHAPLEERPCMKRLVQDMREAMIQCRSVMETARSELPDPVAKRVLTRRIEDLTACIDRAGRCLSTGVAA